MYKRRRSSSRGTIRGSGDYSVNQIVKGSTSRPLTFASGKNNSGDVYITHREFVANVTVQPPVGGGSSQFNVTSYPINPGLAASFPFLSQIAASFTLYQMDGLVYEYKPTSGEYGSSSSNQLGKIIMATNYDPDAVPFTNAVQMENYDYANSNKPSAGAMHGVECKKGTSATSMMYTRSGATPKDKIFTDCGLFQIATEGINFAVGTANAAIVGELWVSYKIRLSRANLANTIVSQPFDLLGGAGQSNAAAGASGSWACLSSSIQSYAQWSSGNTQRFNVTGIIANQFAPKQNSTLGGTAFGYLAIPNSVNPPASISALGDNVAYYFPPNIGSGTYMIKFIGQTGLTAVTLQSTAYTYAAGPPATYTNVNTILNNLQPAYPSGSWLPALAPFEIPAANYVYSSNGVPFSVNPNGPLAVWTSGTDAVETGSGEFIYQIPVKVVGQGAYIGIRLRPTLPWNTASQGASVNIYVEPMNPDQFI